MKTTTITPENILVSQTDGPGQQTSWSARPDQAEKLLPTFAAHNEKVAPGDISAIRDAANDFKKQVKS